MQKLFLKYLKHKDRLWIFIPGFFFSVIFTWLITKGLDLFLNFLQERYQVFSTVFRNFLEYKIPISYLLFFLIFLGLYFATYTLIEFFEVRQRDFKILKATYGRSGRTVDITSELNNAVMDGSLSMLLSNNIAGDPCPGLRKIGKIDYQYNGKKFDREYLEDELIILPGVKLTDTQVQAIISLLESFGAPPEVILGAEKALRGRGTLSL